MPELALHIFRFAEVKAVIFALLTLLGSVFSEQLKDIWLDKPMMVSFCVFLGTLFLQLLRQVRGRRMHYFEKSMVLYRDSSRYTVLKASRDYTRSFYEVHIRYRHPMQRVPVVTVANFNSDVPGVVVEVNQILPERDSCIVSFCVSYSDPRFMFSEMQPDFPLQSFELTVDGTERYLYPFVKRLIHATPEEGFLVPQLVNHYRK